MKNILLFFGFLVAISLIPAVFAGAVPPSPTPSILSPITYKTYEIEKPIQLTNDPHYDRNPSYFKDNSGKYWVFFARSEDGDPNYGFSCEGMGCDAGTCNCDAAKYDIYYLTSTDLSTWTEHALPGASGIGQRDIAAFQAQDGTIWVFTASGFGGSTDDQIRYYTYDGTTWTGPTILTAAGTSAGHVDAFQSSDGAIWVIYEQSGPDAYAIYTLDNGATWSTPVKVNSGGIKGGVPKGMEAKDGTLMVVYTNNGNGIYLAKSTDGGTTWIQSPGPVADSSVYDYDPNIYQDSNGIYWLFYAPWDAAQYSQWIEFTTSTNSKTWSSPIGLTAGGFYGQQWWDFWPEIGKGSDMLIFYTSEQDPTGTYRQDGNIWMVKIKDRISEIQQENSNQWNSINNLASQITGLVSDIDTVQNTIVKIQTTIQMLKDQLKSISDYLKEIDNYLKSGYGTPSVNYCGDGVCDANIGETSSTCPEDCVDGALPSEIFITEGWKVTCPEIFASNYTGTWINYTIDHCRAELLKGTRQMINYTLSVGQTKKVNWHAGYLLRLYGIVGTS